MIGYSKSELKSCFYASWSRGRIRNDILKEIPDQEGLSFDERLDRYIDGCISALAPDSSPVTISRCPSKSKRKVYQANSLFERLNLQVLYEEIRNCYHVNKDMNVNKLTRRLIDTMNCSEKLSLIRSDIVKFYESIPFDLLAAKLERDGRLRSFSIKLLKLIDRQYHGLSGCSFGLPTGLNISSLLSEIYLEDFDRIVISLPGIYRYLRYHDDLIIFFRRESVEDINHIFSKLQNEIKPLHLALHTPGEILCKAANISDKDDCKFYFCGYCIEKFIGKPVIVTMDDSVPLSSLFSIKHIVDRFISSISNSEENADMRYSPLTDLLRHLRKITSTFVYNESGKVMLRGIPSCYTYMTDIDQLIQMDEYRISQLRRIVPEIIPDGFMGTGKKFSKEQTSDYIVRRCMKYTFADGFKGKKTYRINYKRKLRN